LYRYVLIGCFVLSVVAFIFGVKPGSLTGLRLMNFLGWGLGAVVAPIVTLAFRSEERKKSNSDYSTHIPNLGIRRQTTVLLGLMVILSVVHSALWSLQRSF
jgi:uncharacterized membrane protein